MSVVMILSLEKAIFEPFYYGRGEVPLETRWNSNKLYMDKYISCPRKIGCLYQLFSRKKSLSSTVQTAFNFGSVFQIAKAK